MSRDYEPLTDPLRAQRLLQLWFSPSMPTGAFSHGHGIETAIALGDVHDAASTGAWIETVLRRGGARNDAILLAAAYRTRDVDQRRVLDALAVALSSGAERLLETRALGCAFADAVAAWRCERDPSLDGLRSMTLPIVIGTAAAAHRLPLDATLAAALQGTASNLVWIAARLIPLGQQAALRTLAALDSAVRDVTHDALRGDIDELGGACALADLASLQHETLPTRICRT